MKFLLSTIFFLNYLLISAQGFSYQSTIRNNNNQLVKNQYVKHRFTIRKDSYTGSTVYSETQNPLTDNLGNISLIIGSGSAISGNFSQINWSTSTYYMGIEFFSGNTCQWVDITMGSGGQIVSYCNSIYTWNKYNFRIMVICRYETLANIFNYSLMFFFCPTINIKFWLLF